MLISCKSGKVECLSIVYNKPASLLRFTNKTERGNFRLLRLRKSCRIIAGRFCAQSYVAALTKGGQNMDASNERKPKVGVIKVKGTSRTSAVAGAIAGAVREYRRAEVQAIGASAVNQAVKAMALAKSYLSQDGIYVVFIPEFVDVVIDEKIRTAIKFVVEPR